MQMCQDIIDHFQTEPDLLCWIITGVEMNFWAWSKNKMPGLIVGVSNDAVAKENRTIKVKSRSYWSCSLRWETLSTMSSCQSQTINKFIMRSCSLHFTHFSRRNEFWQNKLWLLHHNNALAHKSLSSQQFLAKRKFALLEQPPYSPDLALCDFFLFPKLKGCCFEGMETLKRAVMTKLWGIPEESFQQCIETWQSKMVKCIRLKRDYFAGETMHLFGIEINCLWH